MFSILLLIFGYYDPTWSLRGAGLRQARGLQMRAQFASFAARWLARARNDDQSPMPLKRLFPANFYEKPRPISI